MDKKKKKILISRILLLFILIHVIIIGAIFFSIKSWRTNLYTGYKRVSISADGRYIVATDDLGIHLFEKTSLMKLWTYPVGGISEVAISADGNYILARNYENNVYLFSKSSSNPLWTILSIIELIV